MYNACYVPSPREVVRVGGEFAIRTAIGKYRKNGSCTSSVIRITVPHLGGIILAQRFELLPIHFFDGR